MKCVIQLWGKSQGAEKIKHEIKLKTRELQEAQVESLAQVFRRRIICLKAHYPLSISSWKIGYVFHDIHSFSKTLSTKYERSQALGTQQ